MQTLSQRNDTNGRSGMIVKRVSVPIGLEELMEGLSKEVILRKPKDMYLFASEYFAKLVNLREKSNKYKAHPVHTIQSVTKLRNVDVRPLKKISPAKPVKHISRQLSIRSKSPKLHKPIQTEPNIKREVAAKSKERKTSTDRKDSVARGISKTLLPRDLSKSSNTKEGTSTGTSSVQSTPRDKTRPSVTKKVKSSVSDDQNKAHEENKKTSRQPKRTKSEKVKAALISPMVSGEAVTASAGTVETGKHILKEYEKTKILDSDILADSTSISVPAKINDLQHNTTNMDLDNKQNALISKSFVKSLDSDILAQSTNVAEVSKNMHRSDEDSGKNNNVDSSGTVINNEKDDALHSISSGTEDTNLEQETEVNKKDNLENKKNNKVDEKDNKVDKEHDAENVQNEIPIVNEVADKLNIISQNSELLDNKTDSEVIRTSVEDLSDNIFTKNLPDLSEADDNQDIGRMSHDAIDLVQNIKSETSDADATNNSKLPENNDTFLDNINVEGKDKKLPEEKVEISDDTIKEKYPLAIEEINGTGEITIHDSPHKISEADMSDTIDTNLHTVDSFVSEPKLDVDKIDTDKSDSSKNIEKNISGEMSILDTSEINKTESKIIENEGKDSVVQEKVEEKSNDKLVNKAINETEPVTLVNKDITEILPTIASGLPENSLTETPENQSSVIKDVLQKRQDHIETLGQLPSELSTTEKENNSKKEIVDVDGVISKPVEPNNKNDDAVSNNEITNSSKRNINDKVTIKMKNLGESDDLLTVSFPDHTENIDKDEQEKYLDGDNKTFESMEKMDPSNSAEDVPQEKKQFFRKNEELVSKKDDKTKINIKDTDSETIEDLLDHEKNVPSDISGKIHNMPNVSTNFEKDSAGKLEVENPEFSELVESISQEENLTKNKSLPVNVDNDKKLKQSAHGSIGEHIINYELSENQHGSIDSSVKHVLSSFINNEQLNVFKGKEEQEDNNLENKPSVKESEEHTKGENGLLNEDKPIPLKIEEPFQDTLPAEDLKVYAASPLTFSSVKDLLDSDPNNTLNTANPMQSTKEQKNGIQEEATIVPNQLHTKGSTDDGKKAHIELKADEQLPKVRKSEKAQLGDQGEMQTENESFKNISEESTSPKEATVDQMSLDRSGLSDQVDNESVELKPVTESFSKSAVPTTEGENESIILQNPNLQLKLPGNLVETAPISKTDQTTISKVEHSSEVDNNVLDSETPKNYIEAVEDFADHINTEKEHLGVGAEDSLLKSNKQEDSENTGNLKMTDIATSVDVIQNIMKSKISVQKPGVLDSSVSQYLHSFLHNEQGNVFQQIPLEQKKSVSLLKDQRLKEDSKLNNNKVVNNSIAPKMTNKPSLRKKERSRSHENILSMERKLPETTTKNNKMRRVRSVGIIKTVENEHKSKIPTSARRSAGRRPFVRQMETDSKDIEEKLGYKKESNKISPGVSPRVSKESQKRLSQDSKDVTNKTEKHLGGRDANKSGVKPNEDIKSLPEKDIHKIVSKDIVTKEDVLIAKTILKGIEGAEKHIQLIEERSNSNIKNTSEADNNQDISDLVSEDSAKRNDVSTNIRRKSKLGLTDEKEGTLDADEAATLEETHESRPENLAKVDKSETLMESKNLSDNLIEKIDVAGETIENITDGKNISANSERKSNGVKIESILDSDQIEPTSKEIQDSHPEKPHEVPKYLKESLLDNLTGETDIKSENEQTVPEKSKSDVGSVINHKENDSILDRVDPVSDNLFELDNVTNSETPEVSIDSEKPVSDNLIKQIHGTKIEESFKDTDDTSVKARTDNNMNGHKQNISYVDLVEPVAKDIHEIQSKNVSESDGIPNDPENPLVNNILDKTLVTDSVGVADNDGIKGKSNIDSVNDDISGVKGTDSNDLHDIQSSNDESKVFRESETPILDNFKGPVADKIVESVACRDDLSVNSVIGQNDISHVDKVESIKEMRECQSKNLSNTDGSKKSINTEISLSDNLLERTLIADKPVDNIQHSTDNGGVNPLEELYVKQHNTGVVLEARNSKSDGDSDKKGSNSDRHPTESVPRETPDNLGQSDELKTSKNSKEDLSNNLIKETNKTRESIPERGLGDIMKTSDNSEYDHKLDVVSVKPFSKESDEHALDNLSKYEPEVPSGHVANTVEITTVKSDLSGDLKDEIDKVKENISKDRVDSALEEMLPTDLSNVDSSKKLNDLKQSLLEESVEKQSLPSKNIESDTDKEVVESLLPTSSNKQKDNTLDSNDLVSVSGETVTGDIRKSEHNMASILDKDQDPKMAQDFENKDKSGEDITTVANNKSDEAAITIQKTWKGFHVRKDLQHKTKNCPSKDIESRRDVPIDQELKKQSNAAVKIQSHWKGYVARKMMNNSGKKSGQQKSKQDEAIIKIQAVVRGYLDRLKYQKLKVKNTDLNNEAKNFSKSNLTLDKISSGQEDRNDDNPLEINKPTKENEAIEIENFKGHVENLERPSIKTKDHGNTVNTEETVSDEKQEASIENKNGDEPVETSFGENTATHGTRNDKDREEENNSKIIKTINVNDYDTSREKDQNIELQPDRKQLRSNSSKNLDDQEIKRKITNEEKDNSELNEPQKSLNNNSSADKNLGEDIKRNIGDEILANTLIDSKHGKDVEDQEIKEDQRGVQDNSSDEISPKEKLADSIYQGKNDEGLKKSAEGHIDDKSSQDQISINKETVSKDNNFNISNVEEKATDMDLIGNDDTGIKKREIGNNDQKDSTYSEIDLSKSTMQEKHPHQGDIYEDYTKNIGLSEESINNLNDHKHKTNDPFNKQIKQNEIHLIEDKIDKDILKPDSGDNVGNLQDLIDGDNNSPSIVKYKNDKEALNDNQNKVMDNNHQMKEAVGGVNESKIMLNNKVTETPEKRKNKEKHNLVNQVESNDGLDMVKNKYNEKEAPERMQLEENSSDDKNNTDDNRNEEKIIPGSIENLEETTNEKDPKQENNVHETEKLQEDVLDKNMDNNRDVQENSKNITVVRNESDKNPPTVQEIKGVVDLNPEDTTAHGDVKETQSSNKEKPEFYRSDTVLEPAIIKKAISPLGDTSKDSNIETQPIDGTIHQNEKDGNNNTQSKEETALESEVRSAIGQIINSPKNQSKSSLEAEIKAAVKNIMENNIDSSENLDKEKDLNNEEETTNVHAILDRLPPVPSHEIPDHTVRKDSLVNGQTIENNIESGTKDTVISKTSVKLNETAENISQTDQGNALNEGLKSEISSAKVQELDQSIPDKSLVLPSTPENVSDEKDFKDNKEPPSSEINADDVSSVDSTDSVITVVPNVNYDASNKKEHVSSGQNVLPSRSLSMDVMKEKENKEVLSKNIVKKSLSTDALKGHVDLIDHVQNTLLDQISGKPVDTASKFDIEQLRKKLHEATTLYKSEETDPHFPTHDDELLEYLNDFEPEDENNYDSKIIRTPNRELPDIEEELDSNDDTEATRKGTSEQATSEFCKTTSNITPSAEKLIDNKPLKDHVEILNLEKLKHGHNEIVINNDKIQINGTAGNNTTEESDQKLLHTSELHDMVIPMGSSANNRSDLVGSGKLKHTSEFHDTLVVPLPSGSDVNIKNEAKEMLGKDNLSKPTKTETVDNGNQTANQQSPAGAPVVTSRRSLQDGVAVAEAQASLRDTSPAKPKSVESFTHQSPSPRFVKQAMESEHNNNKRNNAISNSISAPGKNMEAEAATKIQAGFRGYQVRKQLKTKNATDKSHERHSLRRKSSGRKNANTDLAEKSAVKIQAGVRGFLVRRRQKKQLSSSASA